MRVFLIVLLSFSFSACGLIYKLPTRQGNVIEQKQLDQLQTGMTREQVKFLLGTPLAASPFREDRWDYLGYYKSPRGDVSNRLVSIYFADGKLSQMDGIKLADTDPGVKVPSVKSVINEEKKEKLEDSRAKGDADLHGGIFAPVPNQPNQPDASKLPNP